MLRCTADNRPMPRFFDLICFDWDGTLFDSTAAIVRAIQCAVRDVGGTPPDADTAAWVIGMALGPALARAAPDVPPEKYPQLADRYRHHYAQLAAQVLLFDGVRDMLHELRERGHKLAIATGKSRAGLREALRQSQLAGSFDASRTAEECAGKPNPQMLFELMEELGTVATRTLMIGDTSHDVEMARRAGCASVAVSYGAHEAGGLRSFAPRYVAPSVAALRQWLREHA